MINFFNLILLFLVVSCNSNEKYLSVALKPVQVEDSLDTKDIIFTNQFYLLENLTTRLTSLDQYGNYALELASDIQSTDGKKYVIKLRESYFSNGDLISLYDVKSSIERIALTGSSHANFKELIRSIEVLNDSLVINLYKPSKFFFYYLSLPDLGVLHKSQIEKKAILARDFTLSSGPFFYQLEGNSYFLIKNRYYKLTSVNYPNRIKLINPFQVNIIDEVLKGKIHLGQGNVATFFDDLEKVKNDKNIRFIGVPSDSLTYLHFNKYSKNLINSKHRRWLSILIYNQFNVPSTYSMIARRSLQYFPPESKASIPESDLVRLYNYSKSEGEPEGFPREIVIHTYKTAYNVTLEPLVRNLEKLRGVKIVIKNDIDPKDYIENLKSGKFDIFLNIMSTDIRTPMEAISFHYFSEDSNLIDSSGKIKKYFTLYQNSLNQEDEDKYLRLISNQMLADFQFIPLFHSAIPFFFDSNKVEMSGLNHLFVLNLWKVSQK